MKSPEQIVAGLTTAKREVLCAIGEGWSLAPYCGWTMEDAMRNRR